MHAPDNSDPWSSLAESLGVGPGGEPSQQPAPPPRPVSRPAAERPKARPPAPPPASWDALASDLGIEPAAGEPPPRPAAPPPRRAVEPPRRSEPRPPRADFHDEDLGREEPRREQPSGTGRDTGDVHGEGLERRDGGRDRDASSDDAEGRGARDGERRGRRRRGRRGGRRDREGGETREGGSAGPAPAREYDDRPRSTDHDAEPRWDDDGPAPRHVEGDASAPGEREPAAGDRDEDRPRRRRRGRRGGRGRSRGAREAGAERTGGSDREGAAPRPEGEDEPLPLSYGMRPAARPDDARERSRDESGERRGEGERSAGGTRSRRRRRRGGEGRAPGGESSRGRRSRRGDGDRAGTARSSRVRRADFAPVSGTFDEDDEGLEYLGLEDADREPRRRAPRTGEDDALAESGLDSVREVPSWVEAIGIVIAGNLDARSRGRGDGGRQR